MKVSEINISLPFISICLVCFFLFGTISIIAEDTLSWIFLGIYCILGFIIVDLFQIILFNSLGTQSSGNASGDKL